MENFVVSARKYRPQNFSTVVGQAHITTTLKNAIRNNQLAHAFLFCGPRGVGKTTCARILAKTINCESRTADGEACNQCNSCVSFDSGASLNIHELDAASNNSVEDIRTLVEQVRFAPQAGKYKVYIVDEVHMLSSSAFNAFLKTLEEPPPYAIFILATTEKHKILPTILSRCQIFDFKRITNNDTVDHLQEICTKESIRAEKAALHLIAQKSEGCMRDSLSILDKIVSFTNGELTYSNTLEHLNILDEGYFFQLLDMLLKQEISSALVMYDEINRKGFEGDTVLNGFAEFIRNVLVSQDARAVTLLEVADDFRARYLETAARTPTAFLLAALNVLSESEQGYRVARNKRLHVELALIKLGYLQQALDLTNTDDLASGKKKITPNAFRAVQFRPLPNKAGVKSESASPSVGNSPASSPQTVTGATLQIESTPTPALESTPPPKPAAKLGSLAQIRAKVVQHNQLAEAAVVPLTPPALADAWAGFLQKLSARANTAAYVQFQRMETKLNGEGQISITCYSNLERSFLEKERPELVDHLQNWFNNRLLMYQVEQVELDEPQTDKSAPLNRRQQYEMLADRFPLVRDLKERLKLDIS